MPKNFNAYSGSSQLFITIIFSQDHCDYSYTNALQLLNLYTLQKKGLNVVLVINVFVGGSQLCPSSTDITDLRLPTQNLWDFCMLNVHSSCGNYPSVMYGLATNLVCRNVHIFRRYAILHLKVP